MVVASDAVEYLFYRRAHGPVPFSIDFRIVIDHVVFAAMPRLLSTTRQIYINNVRGVFARVVIDAVGPVCQFDYRVNKQVQYEE